MSKILLFKRLLDWRLLDFGVRPRVKASVSLCLCFSLAICTSVIGCGYAFQGSGTTLPEDVQSVSIPMAENDTTVPGLGLRLAEKLRSRFERYGVVKVVDPGASADATLKTKIVGLQTNVREVTGGTDIELEQELVLIISAELRRNNGQLLYLNPALVTSETYGSVSDVVVTSSSQFQQGGISSSSLGSLGSREVSRGQSAEVLDELMEETARKLYLDAVAAEF